MGYPIKSLADPALRQDFLDLNGDRFPDVVGSAGVQYSDMFGGLGNTRGTLNGDVRQSGSTAFNVSAGAGSPARTARAEPVSRTIART